MLTYHEILNSAYQLSQEEQIKLLETLKTHLMQSGVDLNVLAPKKQHPNLRKLLLELKAGLIELYPDNLVKLILYGSQALGQANEESDIDVMLVLKRDFSLGDEIFKIGSLKNQLNLKYHTWISVYPISEPRFLSADNSFVKRVHQEGIII